MTLQTAADAKAASDAAALTPRTILNSLIMNEIDAKITADSTRSNEKEHTYRTDFDFDAEIEGTVAQLIQADRTKVLLSDLLDALTDAGYREAVTFKPASRPGIPDRVHMAVAWN